MTESRSRIVPQPSLSLLGAQAQIDWNEDGFVLIRGTSSEIDLCQLASKLNLEPLRGTFWGPVQRMTYTPGRTNEERSIAISSAALPLHTDGTFEAVPPDILMQKCLAADEPGFGTSCLVSVRAALARISAGSFRALHEERFELERVVPDSRASFSGALCARLGDRSAMRFRRDRLHEIRCTAVGTSALRGLEDALRDSSIQHHVDLQPGEILLIDNRFALHGRSRLSGHRRRQMDILWARLPKE